MTRYFGAIGFPPEMFFREAMSIFMREGHDDTERLKRAWRKLSERERTIFGLPRFPRPWTRAEMTGLCSRIIDTYGARIAEEMAPPSMARLERTLTRYRRVRY